MLKRASVAAAVTLSAFAVSAIATTTPIQATGPSADSVIDTELLERTLDAFDAVGDHSVIITVRDGDETWASARGPRRINEGRPAQPTDRVRIGSLTKSMVSTIVLQLDGEGVIDLDEHVGEYLPDALPYEHNPTVRQLLNHTNGLQDYPLYPSLFEGDLSDLKAGFRKHFAPRELIALGTQDPPVFEPGEGWLYSNTAYVVLGMLVEEVTGNSVGHELEHRVFGVVGMPDTYFPSSTSRGIHGPHLTPYYATDEPGRPYFDTTRLSNSQLWAAGSAISNPRDINAFYRALVDGTLLDPTQLAEATEFVDIPFLPGYQYGLGVLAITFVGCTDDGDERFLGHVGGGFGHETHALTSFDGQRQFAVSFNIDYTVDYDEAIDHAMTALIYAAMCERDILDPAAAEAAWRAEGQVPPRYLAQLDVAGSASSAATTRLG